MVRRGDLLDQLPGGRCWRKVSTGIRGARTVGGTSLTSHTPLSEPLRQTQLEVLGSATEFIATRNGFADRDQRPSSDPRCSGYDQVVLTAAGAIAGLQLAAR